MKYSHLAVVITSLLASLGEPEPEDYTDYQEDCAGTALLSAGLRVFGLRGAYRDVSRTTVRELTNFPAQVKYDRGYNLLGSLGFLCTLQAAASPKFPLHCYS